MLEGGRGTLRLAPKFAADCPRAALDIVLREAIAPVFGRANDPAVEGPRLAIRDPLVRLDRETVGREKDRDGDAAVARLALTPSRLVRVGFTGTLAPSDARAKSLADIRTPAPRIAMELVRARCETAIGPCGARRLA